MFILWQEMFRGSVKTFVLFPLSKNFYTELRFGKVLAKFQQHGLYADSECTACSSAKLAV